MLCETVKNLLYEYIYEELDDDDKNKLEEHLEYCSDCQQEYKKLKLLLIDEMSEVSNIKNEIDMPKGLEKKVLSSLNYYRKPITFFKFAATACLLIMLIYTVPVAAAYIISNTALSKYITFDAGLVKDIKEGRIQYIDKSSTMNGINFRVDGIVKKQDRVTVLFTVKVPKNTEIDYAMPKGEMSPVTLEDQFGRKYQSVGSAVSVKSANKDGEATAFMDFQPLSSTAFKLTIRITGLETGKLIPMTQKETDQSDGYRKFPYKMSKERNVYGKWQVDFYVDKSMRSK